MFAKKPKKNAIEVTKLSSLVADNLQVVGDVLFTGGLRVDGKIEGNVLGKKGEKSLIVLSRKGCIVGRVRAYDAVINGTITGDLEVEHFLELQAGAKVSGNISYRQLQMECGASIEGQLVRSDDKPEPTPVLPSFPSVAGDDTPPRGSSEPA
ncbi:MAG: polymer-forming cytoskeletal protein [Rhodocyclaceae bacterium]